jgi:hypothetical protein
MSPNHLRANSKSSLGHCQITAASPHLPSHKTHAGFSPCDTFSLSVALIRCVAFLSLDSAALPQRLFRSS